MTQGKLFPEPAPPALDPGEHHCHARACTRVIAPDLLMCFKHWKTVPRVIQFAVWATYRAGQCDDKRPSAEWHEAASAAIGYVAWRENRHITVAEAAAMKKFKVGPT